jgi:hypothetical protein
VKATPTPSSWRLALGAILTITAIMTIVLGFVFLIEALEGPGYGSPQVRNALILLGAAGAALGGGISLLIWEGAARLGRW